MVISHAESAPEGNTERLRADVRNGSQAVVCASGTKGRLCSSKQKSEAWRAAYRLKADCDYRVAELRFLAINESRRAPHMVLRGEANCDRLHERTVKPRIGEHACFRQAIDNRQDR